MIRICMMFMIFCGGVACAHPPAPKAAERAEERARDAALLVEHARASARSADYTRAEQYLILAMRSGYSEAEATPELIDVCVKDQRYRAALQYAQEHLRRHPRAYRLRFVEASLLTALGEVAQARDSLERVLSVRPAHADAHYSLAVLLRDQLGDHEQADGHFRDYLRLAPGGVHAEEAGQSLLEAMP